MNGEADTHAGRLLARSYAHSRETMGLDTVDPRVLASDIGYLSERLGTPDLEEALQQLSAKYRLAERARTSSLSHRSLVDLEWAAPLLMPTAGARVVEFGAGSMSDVVATAEHLSTAEYLGVDTRLSDWKSQDGRTFTASSLNSPEIDHDFQMAFIRYTLHHLPEAEQFAALEGLGSILEAGARMYIVEDSLERADLVSGGCGICQDLTGQWNEMSSSERLTCLSINDIWSNCVAYGRSAGDQFHTFRTLDAISRQLRETGFEIVNSTTSGFDHLRIHSVPVLRLVAVRIK